MTEDEAKAKWCPFAFKLGTLHAPTVSGGPDQIIASGPQNRGYTMDGPLPASMCIASACMAWRVRRGMEFGDDGYAREIPAGDGYCGLAGAPQ